jgi:ABC-2 type transport system permease protein
VTNADYLASTYFIGLLRAAVTSLILSALAIVLYSFNLLVLHWSLLPFVFNLLLFGWALGMVSTALIVRWGPAAEPLAWAVPFFVQPFAAVYYPVASLPPALQWVARAIPCSHIFEGMREGLETGAVSWESLALATGLNAVFLALAGMLFVRVMEAARERGLLTKFAAQ